MPEHTHQWIGDQLCVEVSYTDFFIANRNLVATGSVLGRLQGIKDPHPTSTGVVCWSTHDYGVFQVVMKGTEHIKATVKDIATIDHEKWKHEAEAIRRAKFGISSGSEDSTAEAREEQDIATAKLLSLSLSHNVDDDDAVMTPKGWDDSRLRTALDTKRVGEW